MADGASRRRGLGRCGRPRLDRVERVLLIPAPRSRAVGAAHLDRHPARRCHRRLRERARAHALDRPAGARGRALRRGPRAQRRHAALAREHAHRPSALRARRPRQQRLSRPEGHADAGRPAEAARLPQRRLRERLRARRALRARERLRSLGLPRGGRGVEPRLRDPGAARARDRGRGGALARERERARASPSSTSTSPTRPTSRRPAFASGQRASLPRRGGGGRRGARAAAAAAARAGPQRQRTLVLLTSDHGESLGEHGESTHGVFAYEATLRVPLVVYAPALLPTARRRGAGPPRGPRPDRARRAAASPSRRSCRAGACCRCSRAAPPGTRRRATSRRSRPRSIAAGRRSTACASARSSTSTCRCPSSTTWARTPARPATWRPRARRTWSG